MANPAPRTGCCEYDMTRSLAGGSVGVDGLDRGLTARPWRIEDVFAPELPDA